ncbi:MAG TPA: hypothetical protein IAC15_02055 [Candidatus Onthomonas avicola]|nr:hypothetical protein [Candidatus Onthomonas avicola]
MKITTLIALRELAANDLEAATATAEYTRAQLNQKQEQELLDQAEADGADEGTLAKYREDVRRQRDAHLAAIDSQREAQAVLDDLDAHDWH